MAVKEAEENDILDDDDDDDDAQSTSSGGTADRKSKLLADSSRAQHKCSRKPTVSFFVHRVVLCFENWLFDI